MKHKILFLMLLAAVLFIYGCDNETVVSPVKESPTVVGTADVDQAVSPAEETSPGGGRRRTPLC